MNRTDSDRKIPSEKDLCELFRVSRVTVRNALEPLISTGILVSRRGMGTFVNPAHQNFRDLGSSLLGYIQHGGMQSTNKLSGVAPEVIEQSGMDYDSLDIANGSTEQFAELLKGLSGVVWESYTDQSAAFLEVLKKSALPFLLIYRKHLEKESDCIMIDEADEGRKIAEYAKSMGHRNILFLYKTDPKIQLEENTPYTNAMRKLFDLPADQPVPATHLLHFTGLREFVRKPEFRKFTMIYSSGSIARQVMQVLKEAGISVPDDLSYLVYGKAFPGFFNGRTPSAVSIRNNLENAIFDWLDLRFWQKNRNGIFQRRVSPELIPGKRFKTSQKRRIRNDNPKPPHLFRSTLFYFDRTSCRYCDHCDPCRSPSSRPEYGKGQGASDCLCKQSETVGDRLHSLFQRIRRIPSPDGLFNGYRRQCWKMDGHSLRDPANRSTGISQ